jgi:lipoprotein-anchoring transpeptidase ErfK/SrfK
VRRAAAALLVALAVSAAATQPAAAYAAPATAGRAGAGAAADTAPAAAARDAPAAPTREAVWIARLVARTPAWSAPRAVGSPRMLAPLGRWTGGPVGLLVLEVRGTWLRVLLPDRPNGRSAWIAARRVRVVRTRWRVEVDRALRRVTVLRAGRVVRRFGAVVGAPATPTPRGRFAVYEFARQPDPDGFLGPWALHLTAHSDVLDDYGGGPGRVAIHGRAGASLLDPLGTARSHGCIRVDNRQIAFLARVLKPGTPVVVS